MFKKNYNLNMTVCSRGRVLWLLASLSLSQYLKKKKTLFYFLQHHHKLGFSSSSPSPKISAVFVIFAPSGGGKECLHAVYLIVF